MLYVSKKFEDFYNHLDEDEQLEAAKAVLVLCEDHQSYLKRKEREMKDLLKKALEAASELDLVRLAQISEEVEKKKYVMPIDEFIEIHFGLR